MEAQQQGDVRATKYVGDCLWDGIGTLRLISGCEQDREAAREFYQMAVDARDASAMLALARFAGV
jgi:TPR repeat protein